MIDWKRLRRPSLTVSLGTATRTDARRDEPESRRGLSRGNGPGAAALVMLLVIFLTGSAAALFANGGYAERRRLEQRRDAANAELDRRLKRVHGLRREVERLSEDSLARERLAREELGYKRQGEMIFLLAEPPSSERPATP